MKSYIMAGLLDLHKATPASHDRQRVLFSIHKAKVQITRDGAHDYKGKTSI